MLDKVPPTKTEPLPKKSGKQKPKTRRRSPHEIRQELAKKGDLLGLMRCISAAQDEVLIIRSTAFADLFRVARTQARKNPYECVDQIMTYGIGLLSYIALRQGCHLESVLRKTDDKIKSGYETAPPMEVTQQLVPALNETVTQLAELGAQKAFMERQRELTRAKRLENQRTESIYSSARESGTSSPTSPLRRSEESEKLIASESLLERLFTQPTESRPFFKRQRYVEQPIPVNGHVPQEQLQSRQS